MDVIAGIILAHLVGDYLLQSHWMATEKTSKWTPAVIHGTLYTLPFVFLTQSWVALCFIGGTHIVIDRFRLARHITWVKNLVAPKAFRTTWEDSKLTGSPSVVPLFLSFWLMIITDNTIHLLLNYVAIRWL